MICSGPFQFTGASAKRVLLALSMSLASCGEVENWEQRLTNERRQSFDRAVSGRIECQVALGKS